MKANITYHETTGKTTYFAVTVEVDDGDAIHELDIVVVENYEGTSGTVEYSTEDGSIEWITEVPDDAEKRDEIMSAAKEAAKKYVESLNEFLTE
jgi:hypothetical protein